METWSWERRSQRNIVVRGGAEEAEGTITRSNAACILSIIRKKSQNSASLMVINYSLFR